MRRVASVVSAARGLVEAVAHRALARPGRSLAAFCALLAVLLLEPFDFAWPTHLVPNGAHQTAQGLTFAAPGLVRTQRPPAELTRRLVRAPGLTVELWATPADTEQTGPARIVSYSHDPWHRNLMLGQEDHHLVVRIRTPRTDANGRFPEMWVANAFQAGRPVHVAVVYDLREQRVYVDGALARAAPIPGGDLSVWDPGQWLAFGDELTGGRPWRGTLRGVTFHDRALPAEVVRAHAQAAGPGAVADPPALAVFDFTGAAPSSLPLVRPARVGTGGAEVVSLFLAPTGTAVFRPEAYPVDVIANVILFLPFGALAFALLTGLGSGPARALAIALAAALAVSLAAELAQAFLATRSSSLADVACNGLGGLLGAVLPWALGRSARRRAPAAP